MPAPGPETIRGRGPGIDSRIMNVEPRRLTEGPAHHFFGYYGINVWDRSGRYHLALETDFHRRPPGPEDRARVGLVDAETGAFAAVAETGAFNLQQGSMMHWIDAGRGEELTYNAWQGRRVVSHARELTTGATRTLEAPVAAVSADGRQALGLNYARMYHCRSVVGYANETDPATLAVAPEDDGLYRIDLPSGRAELLVSHAQVIRAAGLDGPPSGLVWFNHVMFNTDGSRALFFCRMRNADGRGMRTSLWTVRVDGSELSLQIGFPYRISHFAWLDPDRILISTDLLGSMQFLTFTVDREDFAPIGAGVLPPDGHACFSPDGRWMVCDTYPHGAARISQVMLYEMASGRRVDVAGFSSEAVFNGDVRCDLHPRWHPDGTRLTIDAVPEGDRQIYLLDVADVVA